MKMIFFFRATFIVAVLMIYTSALAYAGVTAVHFDQSTNSITYNANNIPLKTLLAQISRKSGISILVDPSVQLPVIYSSAQKQSLDKMLLRLTRGLNAVVLYNNEGLITTVKLLPTGQSDSGNLVPLVVEHKIVSQKKRALHLTPQGQSTRKRTPEERRLHRTSGRIAKGKKPRKHNDDNGSIWGSQNNDKVDLKRYPPKTGEPRRLSAQRNLSDEESRQ